MNAREAYPYEMHAHEVHAHEMHAREVHVMVAGDWAPLNLGHDQYDTSSRPVKNSYPAFKLFATSASSFRVLSHPPCRTTKMAEAIGAASSVLALTIFAYNTSKSLYEAVSSFRSQRRTIQDVQTDLGSLVAVLGLVREQAQGSEADMKFEPLRQPVQCCTTTCQEMREMLDECTKHAKDGWDSVRDWLNMQYRERSFQDMKQRLASYKSTPSIAFASINMYTSIHCSYAQLLTFPVKIVPPRKTSKVDRRYEGRLRRSIGPSTTRSQRGWASLRDLLQADQAQEWSRKSGASSEDC